MALFSVTGVAVPEPAPVTAALGMALMGAIALCFGYIRRRNAAPAG
jgi:hypothetical protein